MEVLSNNDIDFKRGRNQICCNIWRDNVQGGTRDYPRRVFLAWKQCGQLTHEYTFIVTSRDKEFFNISIDELEELVTEICPTAEFNKTMLAEEFRQSQSTDEIYSSDFEIEEVEDEE